MANPATIFPRRYGGSSSAPVTAFRYIIVQLNVKLKFNRDSRRPERYDSVRIFLSWRSARFARRSPLSPIARKLTGAPRTRFLSSRGKKILSRSTEGICSGEEDRFRDKTNESARVERCRRGSPLRERACERASARACTRACVRACVPLTSKLTLGYVFEQRPPRSSLANAV